MKNPIYSNNHHFGGNFLKEFKAQLKDAKTLTMATGYIGAGLVNSLEKELVSVAKRGSCKLLVGMVYHQGVTQQQFDALDKLDKRLRLVNANSGVFISRRPYHGKIYKFVSSKNETRVYVGSSNFSNEGFIHRLECTSFLTDPRTIDEVSRYLDFLYDGTFAQQLSNVQLPIYKVHTRSQPLKPSRLLSDYLVPADELPNLNDREGRLDIELRVDNQPASSLNLFFDKGRKNSQGKYAPRPWYEVEIQATKKEIRSRYYPPSKLKEAGKNSRVGDFVAFLKDGQNYYKIDMKVHSDGGKNISSAKSSGGRSTLGKYIKGKLQDAGVLSEGQVITSDVLDAYGRHTISFIKLRNGNYIIEF